jgi:hypothetical protein
LRVAERGSDQAGRVNTDDRDIGRRIIANYVGRVTVLSVWERNVDAHCTMNYVAVGENQTIWSEYKARAAALPFPLLARVAACCLSDINFHD